MNGPLARGCLFALLVVGTIVIFVAVVSAVAKLLFFLALVAVVLAIGYVLGRSDRGDDG